jgi:hypothetical protein
VTDFQRAELTKDLIRAQDSLKKAFQLAALVHNLDLAAALRKNYKTIGDTITMINGGPVKIHKSELLGAH